jgi:hypothetical protein
MDQEPAVISPEGIIQQSLRSQLATAHKHITEQLPQRQKISIEQLREFNHSVGNFVLKKWSAVRSRAGNTVIYPYAATDISTPLVFKPDVLITLDERDPFMVQAAEEQLDRMRAEYADEKSILGWIKNGTPIATSTWATDAAIAGIQPENFFYKGNRQLKLSNGGSASLTHLQYDMPEFGVVDHFNFGGITIPELARPGEPKYDSYIKSVMNHISSHMMGETLLLDKGARYNNVNEFVNYLAPQLLVTDDTNSRKHDEYAMRLKPLATESEKEALWSQMEDKSGLIVNFGYAEEPSQFDVFQIQ